MDYTCFIAGWVSCGCGCPACDKKSEREGMYVKRGKSGEITQLNSCGDNWRDSYTHNPPCCKSLSYTLISLLENKENGFEGIAGWLCLYFAKGQYPAYCGMLTVWRKRTCKAWISCTGICTVQLTIHRFWPQKPCVLYQCRSFCGFLTGFCRR